MRFDYSAVLIAGLALLSLTAAGEDSQLPAHRSHPSYQGWGDRGDGTYSNPVMPGDFSDLDAIRVGGDYYAISSTMQYAPGMVVLHSSDLVNWEMVGHVINDISLLDPELNWDKMNRAGRGIWAGAIRYHAGKFWVYFGTPDQGIFMSNAASAAGPWSVPALVLAAPGWDDPCPFWDDDGQAYLVASHFTPEGPDQIPYNIHLFEMNLNGDHLVSDYDRIIHQSKGSEANKLYKIHGLYYHYYSEVKPEGRVAMMQRARSLNGPWEARQLIHVNAARDKEPNQGGFVELPSGKWYFVSHQGAGDWEGRAGVLMPVTWIKGWPVIGRVGRDGIGNMVWHGTKPVSGYSKTSLAAGDGFDQPQLKPAWEWNYQPRADMWSLSENPGRLRLHAFAAIQADNFSLVRNVLTQRAYRTSYSEVTVKMEIAGMSDGQEAGLAHFAATYCTLGVVQKGGARILTYNNNGERITGPPLTGDTLYLRTSWDSSGRSTFAYSTDGLLYRGFGSTYQLTWGAYRGDRVGLFTVNRKAETGYVDFDSFEYHIAN